MDNLNLKQKRRHPLDKKIKKKKPIDLKWLGKIEQQNIYRRKSIPKVNAKKQIKQISRTFYAYNKDDDKDIQSHSSNIDAE